MHDHIRTIYSKNENSVINKLENHWNVFRFSFDIFPRAFKCTRMSLHVDFFLNVSDSRWRTNHCNTSLLSLTLNETEKLVWESELWLNWNRTSMSDQRKRAHSVEFEILTRIWYIVRFNMLNCCIWRAWKQCCFYDKMILKERVETRHVTLMFSFRKRLMCASLIRLSLLSLLYPCFCWASKNWTYQFYLTLVYAF